MGVWGEGENSRGSEREDREGRGESPAPLSQGGRMKEGIMRGNIHHWRREGIAYKTPDGTAGATDRGNAEAEGPELSWDLWETVLSRLTLKEGARVARTCRTWRTFSDKRWEEERRRLVDTFLDQGVQAYAALE